MIAAEVTIPKMTSCRMSPTGSEEDDSDMAIYAVDDEDDMAIAIDAGNDEMMIDAACRFSVPNADDQMMTVGEIAGQFDEDYAMTFDKFSELNVMFMCHCDGCFPLSGQPNVGLSPNFTVRRFTGACLTQLCYTCHLHMQVTSVNVLNDEKGEAYIECSLGFESHKPVLDRSMAHRWNDKKSGIDINERFTIRVAKCVEYGFVENIECTAEGRSFSAKVKTASVYGNTDNGSFTFENNWIQSVYREVVECFGASGDNETVFVLGHHLRKVARVRRCDSIGTDAQTVEDDTVDRTDNKWPVQYLLQTLVTNLSAASEWLMTQHTARYVKFVLRAV
jgi:hypothetical protein